MVVPRSFDHIASRSFNHNKLDYLGNRMYTFLNKSKTNKERRFTNTATIMLDADAVYWNNCYLYVCKLANTGANCHDRTREHSDKSDTFL